VGRIWREREIYMFNKHNLCYHNLVENYFVRQPFSLTDLLYLCPYVVKEIRILVIYTEERKANSELKLKKSQVKKTI